MAFAATYQRQFGLAKETVRGTAETAPTKWYPVAKDSSFVYDLEHLKDDALRGVLDQFPSVAGMKKGTGKVKMPLDAQTCVEFFRSLLGTVTSVQSGATTAYLHTITKDTASISRPSYTFFLDYGLSIIKKYNLGVVSKIALTGPVDNLVQIEADVLFKSEATGTIGTPAFPTQRYFSFNHADFKLGGTSDADVKSWQIAFDGGSLAHRVLAGSQDISDVLVKGNFGVTGKFVKFFASDTERAKFLANTMVSAQLILTHVDLAGTAVPYKFDLTLPKIQYKAFPYDEEDGLLAAKVDYEAVWDSATSKSFALVVTNADVSY